MVLAHFSNAFIRVTLNDVDGIPTVEVSGEIDLSTLPHFQRILDEAIAANCRDLLVDLRSVTFIDSSGVGALIGAKKRLLANRGELHVVCGDDVVRRRLGMIKLSAIMCLHASPEEALQEIRGSQPDGGS
ncbi:MAG: STAS domain-containing protein [Armatimonadota bacterium]